MNKTTRYIIAIVFIAVFGGLFAWYKLTPGKYDQLATCLTEKKVTFYGAFWCPHCQTTKKSFGKSARLLSYVECSEKNPNAQGGYDQIQICTDKNIEGYPTWEFADGTRLTGEQSLADLAAKAGCSI